MLTYWQVGAHTFDMRVWCAHHVPRGFQHWAFLLALLGFGTLIPIWPLHTWSPDGHVAAPTAVVDAARGRAAQDRRLRPDPARPDAVPAGLGRLALLLAVIGVINVVYGAFCAMSQTDLKYVIGYSSVSHMGYVLLGLAARRPVRAGGRGRSRCSRTAS